MPRAVVIARSVSVALSARETSNAYRGLKSTNCLWQRLRRPHFTSPMGRFPSVLMTACAEHHLRFGIRRQPGPAPKSGILARSLLYPPAPPLRPLTGEINGDVCD